MSKYRKIGYKKNTKRNVGAELEGMLFALETLLLTLPTVFWTKQEKKIFI